MVRFYTYNVNNILGIVNLLHVNKYCYYRYYPPGCNVPWMTLVGSANLGERSVRRDLEAQAAILTVSPDLQVNLYHYYMTT